MADIDTSELIPARIIPTSGIGNAAEQERRATSALLAVVGAVQEFGRAFTRGLGAPAGDIECFIEVPFKLGDDIVRPDGLIVVSRRSTRWSALVEVKTHRTALRREQVEAYIDVARQYGVDAVLTISNQLSPDGGEHPISVDRRRIRSINLAHMSWVDILTAAVMEHDHRGVSDPDQAWILGELIAYLEHPNSGALSFDDMGEHWTTVTTSARDGTLRLADKGVEEVIRRWDEFVYYLCLELGRQLGANIRRVTPGADSDPDTRRRNAARELVDFGGLYGTLRIPNAVGDLEVVADLAKRQLSTTVGIPAPRAGQPRTRLNWLVRQLSRAPDTLRVDVRFAGKRQTTSNLLSDLREDLTAGLLDRETNPRSFEISSIRDLAIGRRSGRTSFIDSLRGSVQDFYEEVVQEIRPWAPSAPRLTTSGERRTPIAETPRSRLDQWLQTVKDGEAS